MRQAVNAVEKLEATPEFMRKRNPRLKLYSYEHLSQRVGVKRSTFQGWVRRAGIQLPDR